MMQEENQQGYGQYFNNISNSPWTQHKPKRLGKPQAKKQKQGESKFDPIKKKLAKKIDTAQQTEDKKLKPEANKLVVSIDRQVETICEILKYMLGEYQNQDKPEYCNEYNTCEKWEVDEIMRQVSDTNLGDFIIKLPNPDNISQKLQDIYGKIEQGAQPFQLNASQAMEFYYDLFDIQTASKLDSQREHVAFLIAFYFLRFKPSIQDTDVVCIAYLKIFDYFKKIENKLLSQYITMRLQKNFENEFESYITKYFKQEFIKIQSFNPERPPGTSTAQDDKHWTNLKHTIYQHLKSHIIKQFQNFIDHQNQAGYDADKFFFANLMGKAKSISDLLKTFPGFMEKLLKHLRDNNKQNEKLRHKRILFGGQYLKKTVSGESIIWVNTKGRPNDVSTLLRFSLLYKLVVKSKLFVRSFLSRNEEHIMLVIKTSEQILENYAQKYKINMEVDLGASDLFSFQPVDHYLRPLRLHSYIRDLEFHQKYGIKKPEKKKTETKEPQKNIKDNTKSKVKDEDELKSIQSEAVILYQKATIMNQDQLRTKIIMDQFEADYLYDWVSKTLNIDYIRQKILVNEYNTLMPSRNTWELYYIYNKIIIQFIQRAKNLFKPSKKNKQYFQELQGNIGMILRLMFLKALAICNDLFYNYRQTRSIIPRSVSNLWTTRHKLRTIWYYMGVDSPSGFSTYRRTKSNQRLWRKFQVNELKDRSKFFPSERLIITNKVIYDSINLSKSLEKSHIIDYYPLHDPFVLKNIEIAPYIANIKKLKKQKNKQTEGPDSAVINRMYSQYQCEYSKGDFTKMSIEQKLSFSFTSFKTFSAQSVRYYCGQKIAFYFQFMKFLAMKAYPFLLLAMIIQILLWVEQTDITSKGTSNLTQFNNALIFIYTFINVFWTTNLVQTWKAQQRKLAQNYGVSELTQFQEKRVKFQGNFKRNFETDELNFEYVPKWKTVLKTLFTTILSSAYVLLVALSILLLFLFKTYLYQRGLDQTIVNQVPSILISITSQIFNKIYMKIIKSITIFQNHKTVSDYEGSLISKASLISFIINFYSIFIYAYFSDYLASSFVCQIRTTQTLQKIQNCDYFVSSQLLSLVMVDMAMTIVGALLPFVMFKLNDYLQSRKNKKVAKFNYSFFESIDNFYEQQDKMATYMFTEELDNSWQGYMTIITVFTATALFAPALPFAYAMMFITGIIRLHTSKYEVIYLKKRILPIKANSINWWLIIVEAISYLSIVTNIAYMIYTRAVFTESKAKYFFLFIILFFALKYYLLSQYSQNDNQMAKRNQIKTMDILLGRRKDKYENIPEDVNTDIENVIYDEAKLNRKFHALKQPNLRPKNKKL